MDKTLSESPAQKAIRILGAKRIAHACNLTTEAVGKWPRRNGGVIPSRHLRAIMRLAAERGADFTAEEAIGMGMAA